MSSSPNELKRIIINEAPVVSWDPVGGKIELRDGRTIDVTGSRWVVHTPTARHVIDWGKLHIEQSNLLNAIRRWIAHRLKNYSVSNAVSAFDLSLSFFNSDAFISASNRGDAVTYLAFSQAQEALRTDQRWYLHHVRDFYRWCVSQQFPQFLRDVAIRLDGVTIGGNTKGEAVRSADPDTGPLDALEVAELATALRVAYLEKSMPLSDQAALWLGLAFGANSSQYSMMREEDIKPQYVSGQLATTLINVPRIKKGQELGRVEFQTRKANRWLGHLLIELIEENRQKYANEPNEARPLLWRDEPLDRGEDLEEWRYHLTAQEFNYKLRRAMKLLRVRSRTGGPLRLSPRRLRYSMASRMVQSGASPYAVAVALDHSDLQNVSTYFDVDSSIIVHLDKAFALTSLGSRAQAFTTIVEKESDAINGDKLGSRRYHADREAGVFEPIGTCGHSYICNVTAPYGCYQCPKFQPWMDGPHELVLDALIENRNRREELGLDLKIIAIEDELIAHVASTILRIKKMRESKADNDE